MTFSVANLARYAVMGVLNVTPDSFSDGGQFLAVDAALDHGRDLVLAGAAMVDIGGESSRPGATPVALDDELARVVPVVTGLANELVVLSVDTTKAAVAEAALRAGASVVNDISAGLRDAAMLATIARHDGGVVLMHMQGTPATMQNAPCYDDVVREVIEFLCARVRAALAAGIREDAIMVDPGIGFAKTFDHNLELIGALEQIATSVPAPLVVGTSRKGFLGTILGGVPANERDAATLATTVHAFLNGAAVVRVHDARASVNAARVLDAIAVHTNQRGVLT